MSQLGRKNGKRLIALAWTERLAGPKQPWAAMYRFALVSSSRGDKIAKVRLAASRPMGI